MNTDSYSDLHTKRPLKTITEHDVVEAIAHSGARGEIAVLERYTPYMLEGTLTKGALFQLAFLVEDADADSDRGLLYSAVVERRGCASARLNRAVFAYRAAIMDNGRALGPGQCREERAQFSRPRAQLQPCRMITAKHQIGRMQNDRIIE
jgi:hypothetical protein